MMKSLKVNSLSDLPDAAAEIIDMLGDYKVVALYGSMGAGKTTLVREIAAQMGVTDSVTSPTFALVNQYNGSGDRRIFHFDFYRIDSVEEAYDFGYEEYFYSGDLCFVEWPQKITELMPEKVLTINIEADAEGEGRVITIEG